jgi:uncharacterized membrane protein
VITLFCEWSTMGLWAGLTMTVGGLLLIGLLAWLATALVQGKRPGGPSAMATLDDRFARGDLGPEEYLERRSALEGTP